MVSMELKASWYANLLSFSVNKKFLIKDFCCFCWRKYINFHVWQLEACDLKNNHVDYWVTLIVNWFWVGYKILNIDILIIDKSMTRYEILNIDMVIIDKSITSIIFILDVNWSLWHMEPYWILIHSISLVNLMITNRPRYISAPSN